MSFGFDVCTFLQMHAKQWITDDAFHLDVDALNVTNADGRNALYLNQVPNDVTNCICVYDTGGYSAGRYHGAEKPMENPTAQIRVRHSSLSAGAQTVLRLYELLDEIYHETINGHYYLKINSVSPPSYIGCDQVTTAGKAYEFVLNLNSKVKRL